MDITSTSNPKIKWLRSLHSNSTRRQEQVFVVEGIKEITMAIDGGYQPHSVYICSDFFVDDFNSPEPIEIYTISKTCFEKVTYRSSSDGLIAVFKTKELSLENLNLGENPFLIVAESVEKPGNLGAIIRTADGAGADAVIICDEKTDIFNPNVIRASVGTLFSKQVLATTSENLADFLEKHEITAYGALLSKESKNYTAQDFTSPSALILGTEHEGLSKFWAEHSNPIIIPMNGVNDSLNVSNAAAILAYEVVRQRGLVDSE